MLANQFGLFLGADRGDYTRADLLSHLHQQQPYAAGRRMNQRGLAFAQWIGAVHQIMRGHSLQHGRGGLLIGDSVGNGTRRAAGTAAYSA